MESKIRRVKRVPHPIKMELYNSYNLCFLTFNICGLSDVKKLLIVLEKGLELAKKDNLILCIQECKVSKLSQNHINILDFFNMNYTYTPCNETFSGGLLTIYPKTLTFTEMYSSLNLQFFHIKEKDILVGNVYINSNNFNGCIEQIEEALQISNTTDYNLVLVGDFNCFKNKNHSTNSNLKNCDSRLTNFKKLNQILTKYCLVDIAEILNSEQMTHFDKRTNQSSRIDYVFTTAPEYLNSIETDETNISDHKLLFANFAKGEEVRGRGTWKLNEDIMTSNSTLIEESLEVFLDPPKDKNLLQWYDENKLEMRELLREIAINKKRVDTQHEKFVMKKIGFLETLPAGEDTTEKLNFYKNELHQIKMRKIQAKLKHIKEFYLDVNEGVSSAVKKWLFKRNPASNIESITNANGETLTETDSIIETFTQYYKDIYSNKNVDLEAQKEILNKYSKDIKIPKKLRKPLEKPFQRFEVLKAINALNSKSAPGPDGLTSNYYKKFKHIFQDILSDLFNEIVNQGKLPESMTLATIKLIPKIPNPLLPKDFRPISLINTDQKILSHVLCARLKPILDKIVCKNQVAYLPERQINSAIHLTRLMCEDLKNDECIVSLDFSKAFDKLDRDYIFKFLETIGIPDLYIKAVKALYRVTFSMIEINGFLSKKFQLERGVRQGDPLSALLFIVAIEPLLKLINECRYIKQISTKKTSAYADDVITITKVQCLETVFDLVEFFCDATQLEVNKDKSEILSKFTNHSYKSCKTLKTLGIEHSVLPKQTAASEFLSEIAYKADETCNRKMSLRAKALTLDIFIMSKILYKARHNKLNLKQCDKAQKILNQCIWDNKIHEVKQDFLFLPTELGGIGLPSVKFKAAVAKLMDWKTIFLDESQQDHASLIIQKSQQKKSNCVKDTINFLKKCKITIKKLELKNLEIQYEDKCLILNQNTTSKDLYEFFICSRKVRESLNERLFSMCN
ncbi:MAG: reverse transcriptase family protein, partial [Cyanobacteria bacterium P01_D01_bin.116]